MSDLTRVEGETYLYRDESSGAIVNTDTSAYSLHMKRKQLFIRQASEINSLKEEITEIKSLLKELVNGKNS